MQRYNNTVVNPTGQAIAGANVLVTVAAIPAGSGAPAIVFGDDGVTPVSNTVTADNLGRFGFFVPDGKYDLTISGGTPLITVPYTLAAVEIVDLLEFNALDQQPITVQTLNLTTIASGATPVTGTINLYSKSIDSRLYYKDSTGAEIGPIVPQSGGGIPGGTTGDIQKNSGIGSFLASSVNDNGSRVLIGESTVFKGPEPWVDATAYGVRAVTSVPTTTATIGSGSFQASFASVANFQIGDGVNIFGAGATNTMATPAAPTVTPMVALAGTGTALSIASATGSSNYQYCIAAWELGGGISPCSPMQAIGNGQASLGRQTANISNIALSNNTVTVALATPHTFKVGCSIACGEAFVSGTGNDPVFSGRYTVVSVPDSTHFTYTSRFDTRAGATTTAGTSGTVAWYNSNHIVAQAPVTNNFMFIVYGRTNGSMAPIGVMLPQNSFLTQATDVAYLAYDDYGPSMSTPPSFPSYVPSTPPAVASNDNLVTTITNISGNTVTLANAALNSVSNSTAIFDNVPTANAAINASLSFSSTNPSAVYFPLVANGNYQFSSAWVVPTSARIVQAGTMRCNEAIITNAATWTGASFNIPCGPNHPPFGTVCNPLITFLGPLGFYNTNNLNLTRLTLSAISQNQNLVLVKDGGNPGLYTDVQFVGGGAGASEFLSKLIVYRGNNTGATSSFGDFFENCLFLNLQPQGLQTDETPSIFFSYSGSIVTFRHSWMARRGMLVRPPTFGGNVNIDWLYSQGNENPLVTVYGDGGGSASLSVVLKNVFFDTTTVAGVSNLQSPLGTAGVTVQAYGVNFLPAGLSPFVTGSVSVDPEPLPFPPVNGAKASIGTINSGATLDGTFTTSVSLLVGAYPQKRFNSSIQIGTGYPLFTQDSAGAAPTCVAATAGPPFTQANTYQNVQYFPIYANGGVGTASAKQVGSVTSDGVTQQVTCTAPAAIPGAIGYVWTNNGNTITCGTPTPTSCVISQNAGGGTISVSSGGPAGIKGSMVWANNLSLGGIFFANLGPTVNGNIIYCQDCTITNPCNSGGTGAFAKGIGGTWVCN